jgi:hypothetical protein
MKKILLTEKQSESLIYICQQHILLCSSNADKGLLKQDVLTAKNILSQLNAE